ncbi:C1QTNF4 [Branchiostoma lanceolatum]|uniref:C1QTNF4 protein n=1 Tax=Branchiostoma lanceolatum TaxID=7740 RepID=A0A8K0EAT9_BRALA|nr:C1QTNF4 [Branchiostoma lanceolatum]
MLAVCKVAVLFSNILLLVGQNSAGAQNRVDVLRGQQCTQVCNTQAQSGACSYTFVVPKNERDSSCQSSPSAQILTEMKRDVKKTSDKTNRLRHQFSRYREDRELWSANMHKDVVNATARMEIRLLEHDVKVKNLELQLLNQTLELERLKGKNRELEGIVLMSEFELTQLRDSRQTVDHLNEVVTTLQTRLNEVSQLLTGQLQEMLGGQLGIRPPGGYPPPPGAFSAQPQSAFSAARQTKMYGSIPPQRIGFDKIFVNEGADFHPGNGTFVTRVAGVYFFTFTIQSYDGKFTNIALVQNGREQVTLYTEDDDRNIMQSQSIMLRLSTNDNVWLQMDGGTHHAILSFHDNRITFSGYLVYAKFS